MRLNGSKFIPGIRIEINEDENNVEVHRNSKNNGESNQNGTIQLTDCEISVNVNNQNGDIETIVEYQNNDKESYQNSRKCSNQSEPEIIEVLQGTDWESVNYSLEKITCGGDEITGLEVTEKYIILQYYIDSDIEVYDVNTKELAFRLEGHEYGGQCLQVSSNSNILYSGSMDFSLKSWNLEKQVMCDSVSDHCDYVESLAVRTISTGDIVATGGRGDKCIFVYQSDSDAKFKRLQKLQGHQGWIIQIIILNDNHLLSGSEDASIRLWDFQTGDCLNTFEQDAGVSCMILSPKSTQDIPLVFFGDQEGKLSYLDLSTEDVLHLLPNILIGTGKYCRSSKYHDKAVDNAFLTNNGYLITGSSGSKFMKIWKVNQSGGIETTEIKELQILRDHFDYLSIIKVFGNTIYSSCSDGQLYLHSFPDGGSQPHYEMAVDAENESCTSVLLSSESRSVAADPEQSTEMCEGPKRCRTGKTGLVKSSSSFQVSFQLKPSVCSVDSKIRVPTTSKVQLSDCIPEVDEEEWDPEKDSDAQSDDDYEIVYVSDSEEESD